MIRLSYMFDDPYEKLIENLTVSCYQRYGDLFLESVILYFENNDVSQLQVYFENEYSVLYEAEEDEEEKKKVRPGRPLSPVVATAKDLERSETAIKNRLRSESPTPIDQIRQGADYKSGHTSLGRKLAKQAYKHPTGKAIVKGIRKAAYGTDLGRKAMGAYADLKDKNVDWRKNLAAKHMDKAMVSGAESAAHKREAQAERDYNKTDPPTIGRVFNPFNRERISDRTSEITGLKRDAHTQSAVSNMRKMRANSRIADRIRQNLRGTEASFTQKRDQRQFEKSLKKQKIPTVKPTKTRPNVPNFSKA